MRHINMSYIAIFLQKSIKYVINDIIGGGYMSDESILAIFEQIDKLKNPSLKSDESTAESATDKNAASIDPDQLALREVLTSISEEIQRVRIQNNLTQYELCQATNMSQSNLSKIQNGKIMPRIDTLLKIASVTHTKLVISFEDIEEEEE